MDFAIGDRERCADAPFGEDLLEPSWKSQFRLHPGTLQIASRQREYGNRCDRLWRRDPTIAAIIRCGAVTVDAMSNRGPQARSFGIDFHRVFVEIVVSLKISLGDKAGEAGEPLHATGRLDILVKYFSGSMYALKVPRNFVGNSQYRLGVLLSQIWNYHGLRAATMAGITGNDALSAKPGLIDAVHHRDHSARSPLQIGGIGIPSPVAAAFLNMTLRTIQDRKS